MICKSKALVAAVAATAWGLVPIAHSQTDETSPPPSASEDTREAMPPSQQSPDDPSTTAGGTTTAAPIDQTKIEQFADAYVEVQTIQQQANTELQTATDPAQADEVKNTAQSQMIAAVERSGLQIEEFNHIVASMAADSQLRSRVSAEVQKRVGADEPTGGGS
jgi:hypothetical protein